MGQRAPAGRGLGPDGLLFGRLSVEQLRLRQLQAHGARQHADRYAHHFHLACRWQRLGAHQPSGQHRQLLAADELWARRRRE